MKHASAATVEVFSLSFLDCICCGFGAIILLLVLTESASPIEHRDEQRADLQGQIASCRRSCTTMRGETDVLNRELQGRVEELRRASRQKAARARRRPHEDPGPVQGQQEGGLGHQHRRERARRGLPDADRGDAAPAARTDAARPTSRPSAAFPIDSEYVIFIIDTSAQHDEPTTGRTCSVIKEILEHLPAA